MAKPIEEIEGIGATYGEKLSGAGIATTDALLDAGATKKGRQKIAADCDISETLVLKWVNMADLFRIKGVAGEYAELLECSGVDTVKELATRNAANLAAKVAEVNAEKKLTRRVPDEAQIQDWIKQAGALPPRVTH